MKKQDVCGVKSSCQSLNLFWYFLLAKSNAGVVTLMCKSAFRPSPLIARLLILLRKRGIYIKAFFFLPIFENVKSNNDASEDSEFELCVVKAMVSFLK